MQEIVQLCDENVWHATAISQKLQKEILTHLDNPMLPDEYSACTHQARELVYEEIEERLAEMEIGDHQKRKRRTKAQSVGKNEKTFAYLAAAARKRENRLEPEQADQLLQSANEQLQNDLTMPALVQEGLIEHRVKNNRYLHLEPGSPRPKHYCVTHPQLL